MDGAVAARCETADVAAVFATSCAVSACHVLGGQYPALTHDAIRLLLGAPSRAQPGQTLVVPRDSSASWLYRKVTGAQGPGGGLLMPIGSSAPIDGVSTIEAWISAGAPVTCEEMPPATVPPVDPNSLDQAELFTCTTPATASPARIRRVERTEWTHSVGRSGGVAGSNPFYAPEGRYSTFSADVTIDAATLELYLLVLPEAAKSWTRRDTSPRLFPIYSDPSLACMFRDSTPSGACIDNFLDRLLETGVLFRAPEVGERARLRAFLVSELATEGGDATLRPTGLAQVASAAWMTSGALFRRELGVEDPRDPTGRRRLGDDELGLALGGVISTHPPGSALPQDSSNRPGEPDRSSPARGWLGQIRAAAKDGTIQDPAVIRSLLAAYRGGVDIARADLAFDGDPRRLPARGEYWLAPRIAGFFREWLDYGGANSAFKDTPAATSAFEHERLADLGFKNIQEGNTGNQSTLVTQLDDTVARAVIESESNGGDVLRTLLTTRTWRLPSNVGDTNGVSCTRDADCSGSSQYRSCQTSIGLCGSNVSNRTVLMHRVYGLTTNVPETHAGRWVQLPSGERAGVLTHPAWLAAHGGNFEDDASAVLRGRWIREHFYCESVPGLELVTVEAQLVPSDPALRARDRIRMSIEQGPESATCMGCHRLMNSLGMPFEIYNHAGFLRANDHGAAPDGRSVIDVAPDPSLAGTVSDAIELSEMLAASPYARRCFVRHVFRYFMGRDERLADGCTLAAMETAFAGGSFFSMLDALFTSDAFLYRTIEGGGP